MVAAVYFACEFLYTAARAWAAWKLVDALSEPRWGRRARNAVCVIVIAAIPALDVWNNMIISNLFSNTVLMMHILLQTFIWSAVYRCRIRDAFCGIFLLWVGLALVDFFVQTLAYIFLGYMGLQADLLLTATVYRGGYLLLYAILLCKTMGFVCKWLAGRRQEAAVWLKWAWLLVPLLLLCMIYFQSIYILEVSDMVIYQWWIFLSGMALAAAFFVLRSVLWKEKERGRILRQGMETVEAEYSAMLREQEEREVLLHDIRHHMQVICEMAEKGQNGEILQYMEEVYGVLRKGRNRDLVNHALLNLILNRKLREAEEEGIAFQWDPEDMGALGLEPVEICALFSNILDNAIEANRKLPEGTKRWIQFKCKRKGELLTISAANPLADRIRWAGNLPKTTKPHREGHGLGMRSIWQIVHAHGGHMLIETENGVFSLKVYLRGFGE